MRIDKFTVAVNNIPEMVEFYNSVFDARLVEIEGTPFYAGQLAGIDLLFCPKHIPQIEVDRNNIQCRFVVDNIDAIVDTARNAGGAEYGDYAKTETSINWGILDPDGNSIELIQKL